MNPVTGHETMLSLAQSANLLANLLLPYSIPDRIVGMFLCYLLAVLAAALFGARVTAVPFRCQRIVGAASGVVMGGVLSPLAFGISNLLVNLTASFTDDALPPANTGFAITNSLFILIGSSVAYFAGMLGRPARVSHGTTMETLNQNLHKVEEIVSGKLRGLGVEVSRRFDVGPAQNAGILSQDQATRLEHISQMRNQLEQARSVLRSDVELWAGKSSELLDELTRQLAANHAPTIAITERDRQTRKNGNPYAPPAP